jgi:6-phosphogluconolactonase/glucosamine-6-phosphate isomerase/deaminase
MYDVGPAPQQPRPLPRAPRLPGVPVVREDTDAVLDALCADVASQARSCVRAFGDFHLALSAPPALEPLLVRLMLDPRFRDVPWKRTRLWMVDEVDVPDDHPEARFPRLSDTLASQADIPPEQVHRLRARSDDDAHAYERELREVLEWREKGQDRLDMVILDLAPHPPAPDSPPADAFPPVVPERLAIHLPGSSTAAPARSTLTLGFVNAARFVAVHAPGADRRAALARVSAAFATSDTPPDSGSGGAAALPAPPVLPSPLAGELRWYLDRAVLERPA